MATQPYVTVIIGANSPGPLVDETVRSVRRQSSKEWEIVIVPTDAAGNYAGLVQALASGEAAKLGHTELAVVRSPASSLSEAWNLGVQCARGEAILPLKAGDVLQPRAIEHLTPVFQEESAPFIFFDHKIKGSAQTAENKGVFHLPRLLKENYIDRALAVRKSVWADGGDWEFIALGDSSWNFVLKLAYLGHWGCYLPELLADLLPGPIEKPDQVGYNAPDPRTAVELLHPYFFSPQARIAVKRLWEPSICIVVQGEDSPNFDNQTVRDFQILQNVSEAEALSQSRAVNFLWLTGSRSLRPHAVEECIWGLRSAEWVTWSDTGDAPPPSVRSCAGPLGVSRWALQTDEAKRTGEVCRLPWRCREETRGSTPAAPESPVDAETSIELAPPPPADQLQTEVRTSFSGRLARRFGGVSDWRKHPVDSAAKLIPSRYREGLGNVTVGRTYDVDGSDGAEKNVDSSKRVSEPVEYMPPPAVAERVRIALWTPHFGAGGVEKALFDLAGEFRPDSIESFICATDSNDSGWRPLWRDRATHLYDVRRLLPPEGLTAFAVSFARNWKPRVMLMHGLAELHTLLEPIKNELPTAKLSLVHRGCETERNLFTGSTDWLGAVDRHIVSTEAGAKWLYEMAVPEREISVIRPGVDCAEFDPTTVDSEEWLDRLGTDKKQRIILFAGRLIEANQPLRVLDIAARLKDMRSSKGFHFVIAGDGPLQEALRSKITARDLGAEVTLAGFVPDIRSLLAASAVMVLPAAGRELPQIVLESLAMKVPVIARRGEDLAGTLGGDCLELVGEDEEEDVGFARAIDTLLGNAKRRGELGANGRQLIESEYPIEKSRAAWREWLSSVTS